MINLGNKWLINYLCGATSSPAQCVKGDDRNVGELVNVVVQKKRHKIDCKTAQKVLNEDYVCVNCGMVSLELLLEDVHQFKLTVSYVV